MILAVRVAPTTAYGVLALLFVGLMLLAYGPGAAPPSDVPWHGPDTHSSLPHRAPGISPGAGLAPARAASEDLAASVVAASRGLLVDDRARRPEILAIEPPEHPPR